MSLTLPAALATGSSWSSFLGQVAHFRPSGAGATTPGSASAPAPASASLSLSLSLSRSRSLATSLTHSLSHSLDPRSPKLDPPSPKLDRRSPKLDPRSPSLDPRSPNRTSTLAVTVDDPDPRSPALAPNVNAQIYPLPPTKGGRRQPADAMCRSAALEQQYFAAGASRRSSSPRSAPLRGRM